MFKINFLFNLKYFKLAKDEEFLKILQKTYPEEIEPLDEIKNQNELSAYYSYFQNKLSFVQLTYLISKFLDEPNDNYILRNKMDVERLNKYYGLPVEVLKVQTKSNNMFVLIDPKLLKPFIKKFSVFNEKKLVLEDYDFYCLSLRNLQHLRKDDQEVFHEFIILQNKLRYQRINFLDKRKAIIEGIASIIYLLAWILLITASIKFEFFSKEIPDKSIFFLKYNIQITEEQLKPVSKLSLLEIVSLIFLSLVMSVLVIQFYYHFIPNHQMIPKNKEKAQQSVQSLKNFNKKRKRKIEKSTRRKRYKN